MVHAATKQLSTDFALMNARAGMKGSPLHPGELPGLENTVRKFRVNVRHHVADIQSEN
mgnify:CR=1 FL=1